MFCYMSMNKTVSDTIRCLIESHMLNMDKVGRMVGDSKLHYKVYNQSHYYDSSTIMVIPGTLDNHITLS